MAYPKKVSKTKSTKHVCSGCIEFFDAKDLFVAHVPDRDYSTIYCAECLKELGITEFRPYHKVSEKKPKVEKTTTPKTKKATAPKTKKGTKILASEKDAKIFFESITTPSTPNEALKKAAKVYKEKTETVVEKPKRKYTRKATK
jgi:hypothetical protein